MSTSFNFDAVIANLVQENGLAPVLKDYLSSGGTLSVVLDRLDGYAVSIRSPCQVLTVQLPCRI